MARPKSLLWLFPHLKVRPPPPDPSNDVRDCWVSRCNRYKRLRTDLPFPVGKVTRDEAVWLIKAVWFIKPIRPRCYVHRSTNDSFCSSNITIYGAYLSPREQLTPISAHQCCETRGDGARGFLPRCNFFTWKINCSYNSNIQSPRNNKFALAVFFMLLDTVIKLFAI